MKKTNLIESLRKEFNINRADAKLFVDSFFEEIVNLVLETGRLELRGFLETGRLELRGFGVFKIRRLSGRFMKNPKTGIEMYVEERYSIGFKPSSVFNKGHEKV